MTDPWFRQKPPEEIRAAIERENARWKMELEVDSETDCVMDLVDSTTRPFNMRVEMPVRRRELLAKAMIKKTMIKVAEA